MNLPIAAAQLGIDGRQDDAEFADHVRVDERRCEDAVRVPPFLHAEAVSHGVHHRVLMPANVVPVPRPDPRTPAIVFIRSSTLLRD